MAMTTSDSVPRRKLPRAGPATRVKATPGKEPKVIVQVREFPAALKDAIVTKALADQTNMNDVAVAVLAAAFKVSFSPSGRRPPVPAGNGGAITFQMPRLLRRKIKQAAAANDVPMRDVVLGILSNHFRA